MGSPIADPDSDGRGTAQPAWRALVALQVVVLLSLVAAWQGSTQPEAGGAQLTRDLAEIDTEQAMSELSRRIQRLRASARVLMPEDQGRTSSFLSLTATAAGLETGGLTFRPGPAGPSCCQALDVTVSLQGDAFDLPIFLDGLHRQAALGMVIGVALVVSPGGAARALVVLRYLRPSFAESGTSSERARGLGLDKPQAALFERAQTAAVWQQARDTSAVRSVAVAEVRKRLLQELPEGLVALRRSGGSLRWTATAGLTLSPSAKR